MKIDVTPAIVQMEPAVLKHLLHEVKETIATDYTVAAKKTFTAAELWNIRRNTRTAQQRFTR